MFIQIAGHEVFALSFGAGPRTFLAQGGWIGSSEVWLPTLELLSPGWRTVAFDHRGAGETWVPVDAITYAALVDDIFRVMDALAIDRCVLGGESAGAQVVLEAVLRHPERFTGATLVDGTAGLPRPPEAGPSPITGPPSTWPGADHTARLRWFIELCVPEPDAEPIRRWGHHILQRAHPDAAERLWGIGRSAAAALAERFAELQVPVLLVGGSADPLAPPVAMAELARRLPRSQHVELSGAGHVPIMTRPREVAAAIERAFHT
jgi:pimeloyl-[acyl-carrier protein] methyl ester esterase